MIPTGVQFAEKDVEQAQSKLSKIELISNNKMGQRNCPILK
jgi:hypothetical protein